MRLPFGVSAETEMRQTTITAEIAAHAEHTCLSVLVRIIILPPRCNQVHVPFATQAQTHRGKPNTSTPTGRRERRNDSTASREAVAALANHRTSRLNFDA